jgi:hypothetical protein
MEKPGKRGGKRAGSGRPRLTVAPSQRPVTPPQVSIDELEILCQMNVKQNQIAAYFRISRNTLRLLARKHPEVREVMEGGPKRGNVKLLQALYERMEHSDKILILAAKHRLGWVDKIRKEHSGANGPPIETKSAKDRSDGVFRKFLIELEGPRGRGSSDQTQVLC